MQFWHKHNFGRGVKHLELSSRIINKVLILNKATGVWAMVTIPFCEAYPSAHLRNLFYLGDNLVTKFQIIRQAAAIHCLKSTFRPTLIILTTH